jgi:hypothetical protein
VAEEPAAGGTTTLRSYVARLRTLLSRHLERETSGQDI